jgi:hypothetical protein
LLEVIQETGGYDYSSTVSFASMNLYLNSFQVLNCGLYQTRKAVT